MINKELRAIIAEISEEALLFDNPAFDNSIFGLTTDGAVIYDLRKMIKEMSEEDNISEEDAYDFISYNTLSAYIEGLMSVVLDDDSLRYEIENKDNKENENV